MTSCAPYTFRTFSCPSKRTGADDLGSDERHDATGIQHTQRRDNITANNTTGNTENDTSKDTESGEHPTQGFGKPAGGHSEH